MLRRTVLRPIDDPKIFPTTAFYGWLDEPAPILPDELKRLYHALFRSGQNLGVALAAARKEFRSDCAGDLREFVAASKRGICADTGKAAEDEMD